jgi:Chaperone of endosialidase
VTPNGGNIVITWNASGIFQLSDRRAKINIKPLAAFEGLGLYSYCYKGSKQRQVGFMAQDVAEVVPQAVAKRGRYWGVDYARVLHELAA